MSAGFTFSVYWPRDNSSILRVHFFDGADRIVPDEILHHHHVARLSDGEIGFGRDNQTERLQLGSRVQLALAVFQQHFADVGRAALRRDGPHHIREIFRTELGGRLQLLHFRIDLDHALLALHLGLADGLRHQSRSAKADPGGSAAVVVIDGFGGPRHHRDPINR